MFFFYYSTHMRILMVMWAQRHNGQSGITFMQDNKIDTNFLYFSGVERLDERE